MSNKLIQGSCNSHLPNTINSTSHAVFLTLEEWCNSTYPGKKPSLQTLQRRARNGNFYPAAEKHGKQYRLVPGAIYIDPSDPRLGKKIKEARSIEPARTAFMEKVINDSAKGGYDMRLPKNLTFRRNRNAFYWRNPVTKKEISLGQISRREAIAQAIEANHYIEQNYSPVLLLEKIKGSHEYTLNAWLDRYDVLFKRRELAENTYKVRAGQITIIRERLGDMVLTKITTRHIAEFLEFWIAQNKKTMAATMRSVLSDIFREAIVEGHIENNPVTPTRAAKAVVMRERLELKQYGPIREAAETMPPWFCLAMDLALVSGQRREDLTQMRFSHIVDRRLQVEQGKTGALLSLPLDLELKCMGLRLGTVIDRCRLVSTTDFMISAGIRKNSPDGSIHPDGLTKKFVAARKASGLEFLESPPTFHEIRSLSGRLYEKQNDKAFAQKLLGHTTEMMTLKYLKTRGKEYVML